MECGLPSGRPDLGKNGDRKQPEPVPDGFDYDFWLGPAPDAPYSPARVGVNFRWNYDYSGGQLTDWGGHHPDIAQWGMGTALTGPVRIRNARGKWPEDPVWNTATEYYFEAEYRNGVILKISTEFRMGVTFKGTEGRVHVNRGRIEADPESLLEEEFGPEEIRLQASDNHFRNFIDCVLSRKEPVAPVEQAHRSISICHLGNIAMLLGRDLAWDPDTEQIVGDHVAHSLSQPPLPGPLDAACMKILARWLLAASLIANLALGLAYFGRSPARPADAAAWTPREEPKPAPQEAPPDASAAGAPARVLPLRWDAVESDDYSQFIGNLRQMGCPEPTIRDIVAAEINGRFEPEFQDLLRASQDFEYWRVGPGHPETRALILGRLEELEGRRQAILRKPAGGGVLPPPPALLAHPPRAGGAGPLRHASRGSEGRPARHGSRPAAAPAGAEPSVPRISSSTRCGTPPVPISCGPGWRGWRRARRNSASSSSWRSPSPAPCRRVRKTMRRR